MKPTLRKQIGTLLFDRPRGAWVLRFPRLARWLGRSWVDFHNRHEHLLYSPQERGAACQWQWTSDLTIGQVIPGIASRLLRAALTEWPIQLTDQFPSQPAHGPQVSFIIGHRGQERLPHLLATIRSILGQRYVGFECLVVEQAWEPILPGRLPAGVRHIHLRPPTADMRYSRSWAFNVGARAAHGDFLVFHDNDSLVPADFARQIANVLTRGYHAARLQRFVFHLTAADSTAFFAKGQLGENFAPEFCRQNCEGVTVAVERQAYFELGGHDEAFVGWGGEDNEFFDRLQTLRLHEHAYLPLVHLYHGPQPDKSAVHANTPYFQERMRISAPERIAELSQRNFGAIEGPNLAPSNAR